MSANSSDDIDHDADGRKRRNVELKTFTLVLKWLGVIAGALSLFNLVRDFFGIGLPGMIRDLLPIPFRITRHKGDR